MKKERILIIDIPFNIDMSIICEENMKNSVVCRNLKKSFENAQTEAWIQRRMALFMKYTCNSLIHQMNTDFICLVRYNEPTKKLIYNTLKQYPKLPSNICFTQDADKIIKEKMRECDSLYHIKIDSDNMYAPDFIEKLSQYKPKEKTLTIINQYGYLYEETSKRIASIWIPSPSFSVSLYNKDSFEKLYAKRVFEPHVRVLGRYEYELLEGRNYMVCVHEQNVYNKFYRTFRAAKGELLAEAERERVLSEWHLK